MPETPEDMVARIAAEREGAGKAQVVPKRKRAAKKAGGRPTKYDEHSHPLAAAMLAMAGKTDEEIAEGLGIATSTLYAWEKAHTEFSEAIKEGKVGPDDEVEAALLTSAKGAALKKRTYNLNGSHTDEFYPPSDTACIFWLCNRRPERWRHVNRVEVSGPNGGPIQHEDLTDTPTAELLAEAEAICRATASDRDGADTA
jgi:transcriptional regulator with XRE-family HTH domain